MSKNPALAALCAQYSDSESDGNAHDSDDEIIDESEDRGVSNDAVINTESKQFSSSLIADIKLSESRGNSPNVFSIESLAKKSDATLIDDEFTINDDESDYHHPPSPVSFHRSLFGLNDNEIIIPPEPSQRCTQSLQEKVLRLHKKMKEGYDMNAIIQKRKDFRNPSIYEKLIAYCGIEEMASNYPNDIYDPYKWGPESYYDELSKRQKEEMEKRERERKERTKVEFVTGTAKKGSADHGQESHKKKSKWDMPSGGSVHSNVSLVKPQLVIPVTVASGTKPTVISAFGVIGKKSK